MNYSQNALKLTEGFEGYAETSYKDSVGVWTCGYGHTRGVGASTTCYPTLAAEWLQEDIQNVVTQINRDLKVTVTQGEFDSLVDFAFNLGVHALEHSTLWALLNAGDYEGAAKEFPKWDHAGGQIVEGLLRRRLQEQAQFMGDTNVT